MGHAGFGAAISLRQEVLDAVAWDAWRTAGAKTVIVDVAADGVSGKLFLERPRVRAVVTDQNRLRFDITARGRVGLAAAPGLPGREVRADVIVLVSPRVTWDSEGPHVAIDGSTAEVTLLIIEPADGDPALTTMLQTLASGPLRANLAAVLGARLGDLGVAPPLGSMLDQLATRIVTPAAFRVVDGALVLAANVTLSPTGRTAGDRTQLYNSTAHMAELWQSTAAVVSTLDGVRTSAATALGPGTTVDAWSVVVADGYVAVAVAVSNGAVSAKVSFAIVPRVGRRGGYPDSPEEVWVEVRNAQTTIGGWGVDVLRAVVGTATLGLGNLVLDGVLTTLGAAGSAEVRQRAAGAVPAVPRRHRTELAGGTSVDSVIAAVDVIGGAGIVMTVDVMTTTPAARFWGETTAPVEAALTTPLWLTVDPPFDVHPLDPDVRVTWTLRRTDTGEVLRVETLPVSAGLRYVVVGERAILATSLLLRFDVFRVFGGVRESLYSGQDHLVATDVLDRSHPYVRWRHPVTTPNVTVTSDGVRIHRAPRKRNRVSRLHRTDYPGRCAMAAKFSADVYTTGSIEYLDALPFPRPQLDSYRNVVCDFCFYGGPAGATPLVP